MRRVVPVVVVALTLAALAPRPAWACSCVRSTPEQQLRRVDAVFAGEVLVAQSPAPRLQRVSVLLNVEAVYKGEIGRRVEVSTASSEAACGVAFVPGHAYAVFAFDRGGAWETSLCAGTTVNVASLEEAGLQPIVTYERDAGPVATPISSSRPAPEIGRAGPVAAAAVLAALALAAVIVRLRDRRMRMSAEGATTEQ